MTRYLSWVLNLALLGLACFLAAQSVNTVLAAVWAPDLTGPPRAAPDAVAPASRPWSEREVILTRNLFNASLLAPDQPIVPENEVLEATRLPLDLLGTAAAELPELSFAAVQDRESQQTLVVRIRDSIRNQAEVVRIERRRIVLSEGGSLRELALEEPEALATAPGPLAAAQPRRMPPRAPSAPPAPAAAPAEGARSPAQLFSQARILPKYDAGQMVGVQVSSIKPGSLFEEMGLQDGEVITELNGIPIDSPEQSAKILLELSKSQTFTIQVEGAGGPRTLNVDLPAP
jgi:general secretion pathway protein C